MKLMVRLYCALYGRIRHLGIRRILVRRIGRLEGGDLVSMELRELFKKHHNVTVGLYSTGGCFDPEKIDSQTTFGRYCSIGRNVRVITANHPMHFKSTHVFFYDKGLRFCDRDLISHVSISIGNDVWIGDCAIIMPSVTSIGDGAVVGAGAVVNKNIPPYAVVVGNPARVVRYRFSERTITELLASRWWERSIDEIAPQIAEFQRPYEEQPGWETAGL